MSWDQVAVAVEQRINDLGMSKKEVARRAEVDPSSLWKLRTGRGGELSARMLGNIERALRWPGGTIQKVYDGGEPPTEVLTDVQRLDRLEHLVAEVTAEVSQLVQLVRELRGER